MKYRNNVRNLLQNQLMSHASTKMQTRQGDRRPRACQPRASRLLDGSTQSACQPSEPAQVKLDPFLFDRTTIINIGAASQLYHTGRLEVTECMVLSPPSSPVLRQRSLDCDYSAI